MLTVRVRVEKDCHICDVVRTVNIEYGFNCRAQADVGVSSEGCRQGLNLVFAFLTPADNHLILTVSFMAKRCRSPIRRMTSTSPIFSSDVKIRLKFKRRCMSFGSRAMNWKAFAQRINGYYTTKHPGPAMWRLVVLDFFIITPPAPGTGSPASARRSSTAQPEISTQRTCTSSPPTAASSPRTPHPAHRG